MPRAIHFITAAVGLVLCRPAAAAMLSYKIGASVGTADMHTVVYTNRIGSTPVNGGCIEITGHSITVYGRPDAVSERFVLLNGQLVKTRLYNDKAGMHLKGIAYFSEGALLQGRLRAKQNEIVFIEGGFVSGKIDSFTPDTVLINDHGSPRSIQLSTVLAIRSPRAYNLQMDLSAADANNPSTADEKNNNQPEHWYNASNCTLRETIPPQMISSQSIAPRPVDDDDDFGDLDDDTLLDPALSIPPLRRLGQ